MPGVLQVEAMAQTGGLLVLNSVDEPERYSTYFMKIDGVKFRQKSRSGRYVDLTSGIIGTDPSRDLYHERVCIRW